MPVEYFDGKDVAEIANETVIPKWHPHLLMTPIRYLIASEIPPKMGKGIMAKTRKATPVEQFLCGATVILMVDEFSWKYLKPDQRIALVDHELCHVVEDKKNGGLKMTGHDIEEFIAIVHRHGAWMPDLQEFFWRTKDAQLQLFKDVEDGVVILPDSALQDQIRDFKHDMTRQGNEVKFTSGDTETIIKPDGTVEKRTVDQETGEVFE